MYHNLFGPSHLTWVMYPSKLSLNSVIHIHVKDIQESGRWRIKTKKIELHIFDIIMYALINVMCVGYFISRKIVIQVHKQLISWGYKVNAQKIMKDCLIWNYILSESIPSKNTTF